MKIRILTTAILAAAFAASLGGCSSLGGGGGGAGLADAMKQIATDPTCAHHDEVRGVTGAAGIPASLQFTLLRDCPARAPVAAELPTPPQ